MANFQRKAGIQPEDLARAMGQDPEGQPVAAGVTKDAKEATKCSRQKRRVIVATINKNVKREHRSAVIAVLLKYHEAVSVETHDIGKTELITHKITLRDDEPQYTKQFHLPDQHYQLIKENIREWIRAGIVEPANSPYNSPVFCVQKPDGSGFRVVLDYRKVNQHTLPERYSIRSALLPVGSWRGRGGRG